MTFEDHEHLMMGLIGFTEAHKLWPISLAHLHHSANPTQSRTIRSD